MHSACIGCQYGGQMNPIHTTDPHDDRHAMTQDASDLEQATRVQAGASGGHVAQLSDAWEIWRAKRRLPGGDRAARRGDGRTDSQAGELLLPFPALAQLRRGAARRRVLKQAAARSPSPWTMTQQGKPILHALVKTAADAPGYSHQHPRAPAVPAPESLKNFEELLAPEWRPRFSFWNNIERRPVDQSIERGWPPDPNTDGERAAPVLCQWARYRPRACFEDPFLDAARALILLDTYGFPAAYQRYRSWEYLAPNLDTSAWFHGFSPQCEWLLIDSECSIAGGGLMGVSGRVWDTDGRLLATGAAQLCCIPGDG